MLGVDDSPQNLGVIPCAIAWLYRLIEDQKQSTSTRFSVRVSAVEVTGKQETLTDLLAGVATGRF
jgi:kinesin family protein 26